MPSPVLQIRMHEADMESLVSVAKLHNLPPSTVAREMVRIGLGCPDALDIIHGPGKPLSEVASVSVVITPASKPPKRVRKNLIVGKKRAAKTPVIQRNTKPVVQATSLSERMRQMRERA